MVGILGDELEVLLTEQTKLLEKILEELKDANKLAIAIAGRRIRTSRS